MQIVKELGQDVPLDKFMDQLRNDPKFYYGSPDEVLAGFKDLVDNKINPKITDVFSGPPKHKLEVVPGPQEDCPAAYYITGTPDGSRPGKFFVNVRKYKSQPKYDMMTLALHEGNPGHHLQGSFGIALGNMPTFRQLMEDRRLVGAH